jgi:hypothetical protein
VAQLWGMQGANITSADGSTYLIMQTNGYLSLVSATLAKQYPGSAAANLWMSSNSKSVSGPYVAVMQEVMTPFDSRCDAMRACPISF